MAPRKKVIEKQQPQINNIGLTRSVGEITEEAYILYGGYVSNSRALPRLSDGLKVSIMRLIYMSLLHPKGKDLPTHEFVPSVSRVHPHGTTGLELSAAHMVRSGVFTGHGFFGYTSIDGVVSPPAATRYTKIRLSDLYWDILGDLVNPEYIDFHESPQGEREPASGLPLPLPAALYLPIQTMGLAVGVKTQIPSFNPQSLYRAWKENNPYLLESSVDLIIDKENSELQKLWETGRGRVIYSYKISRTKSPDGKTEGILFESKSECATEIFTPKISKYDKLVDEGKVYIEDLTDENGPKLFVGRVPGARNITVDDIEAIARKICYSATEYQVWVTDSVKAFRIPIKDWVGYTVNNYIKLLVRVNEKKIEKVNFQIATNEALPYISEYIISNPKATDAQIQKDLGYSPEIITAVMSKPISYLRKNKDTSDRVKALKDKLKELKKFDPVAYTEDIINRL